jgi:NADH-quinone oxidoreductase subunit A
MASTPSQFLNTPLQGSLEDYFNILVFMAVAFAISLLLVLLSLWRGPHRPDKEKLSSYECGFAAFGDARHRFDVRFYLVAILFIIFDLEIAFLFPWAVSLKDIGLYGFFSMMVFLAILGIGFIYEWRKGALEWE